MKSGKRARATHKRQHFVPKSYLASWTDPGTPSGQEPYVHLLTKDGSGYRRKAPAKIFRETDLYTIKMAGGLRDLTLEHGLSQLEDNFMRVVREFIVPRRPLPTIPRLKLMLFVAALHARTLKMRDHHSAQWKRLLDIAERGAPEDGRIEWRDGTTDPNAPSYIHVDDIRELVENPMPTTVPAAIDAETPLMMQMHARILCIESDAGFITSDSPVVWMNAEKEQTQETRFWGPSFIHKELEITVPLTPNRALLLRHGTPGLDYVEVPDKAMRMFNARTRHYANQETVSRLGYYEPLRLQDPSLRMSVTGASYVR